MLELINFKATDGVILNGFITKNNSKKIVIATHGMSSNCFKEREMKISKKLEEKKIDFLGYNNRGSELVKYIKKETDGKEKKLLAGTSFEDVLEGYFDIKGAILKAIELGYTDIYLQGHSLGSTKIVYTYNKFKKENDEVLKYVKGVILLSLIDITKTLKIYLGDKYEKFIKIAEEKEEKKEILDLMPKEAFIHPICVKTYLRYTKYNDEINFANYSKKDDDFKELNNIDVPLFMRWGNMNEMIEQDANDLVNLLQNKIKNNKKDINFIDGADHGYTEKEEILANQIIKFLEVYN